MSVVSLTLTENDLDSLITSGLFDADVKDKKEVPLFPFPLTEACFGSLIQAGRVDAKLKDLSALKSHVDSCRTGDHVRVRVVDCSGRLVHKTDMILSSDDDVSSDDGLFAIMMSRPGPDSVELLRLVLLGHFEVVEASYHDKVSEAINAVVQRNNEDLFLKTVTDGSKLGFFSRTPIFIPDRDPGYRSRDNSWVYGTRFGLDGVTFHRTRLFGDEQVSDESLVGDLFIYDAESFLIDGDRWGGPETPVMLLLRSASWDPSFHGRQCSPTWTDWKREDWEQHRNDLDELAEKFENSRTSMHILEICASCNFRFIHSRTTAFSKFSEYVTNAARGDHSLELVLEPELFEEEETFFSGFLGNTDTDPHQKKTPCWVARFSSLEVKKRFVELIQSLALALELDIHCVEMGEMSRRHIMGAAVSQTHAECVCALSTAPASRRMIGAEEEDARRLPKPKVQKEDGSWIERAAPLGLRVGNIFMRIMHKSEILRRLEEPHRTNFDNNDWWYLNRKPVRGNVKFTLMAAESVDESQNKIDLRNWSSLLDLVGTPEALPDEDDGDERLIQLRITTRTARGRSGRSAGDDG